MKRRKSSPVARPLRPGPGLDDKQRLARIRHELRTPINHILGYNELLLEEGNLSGSFRADLEKIHRGGKQLLELLNDYFEEEKFFTAKLDLHRLFHDLRTPVNQIIGYSELLQEQAQEAGQSELVADLQKIRQAANTWLRVAEGHLVPKDIPKNLAEAEADRSLAVVSAAGPAHDFQVPGRPGAAHKEGGKLLVVDDDESNREMLARRLRREGYTVVIAQNGRQALKLLGGQPFDLVLLDLIMPLIGGMRVLEQIKADPALQHIPVIMVSALDDADGIARSIEIGAEDYLSKPFNPVFLRARIGAALEKKRLRDREQFHLKQIEAEQQKSERLLLNVLPKPIAERLKAGERVIADSFPDVTVLFADLVGFTSHSLHVSAVEVVELLNEIFSAFDLIAAELGLEKIKTIGDAYMAVAGLPLPRPDHAEATAELALRMQEEIRHFNSRHHLSIRIRVGINTGPVVAGIIGRDKFSYDLWGDTVNTASRMESHGVPDKIQVAPASYERLNAKYEFQSRGPIEIKGIGRMQTFFLELRKTA